MRKTPADDLVLSLFDSEPAVTAFTPVESSEERTTPTPRAGLPPDAAERSRALDPARSFLVQAPAGSGKTHLLTQRFLRLLALAEKPDEIVAITFTNAAAAEMRHRILDELEKAETGDSARRESSSDPESLAALAAQALAHSRRMGWQLLDQPGQLRILTIDAFCRSLAMQSPLNWGLLSGLGGRLDPAADADELYRRAASGTIERLLRTEDPADAPAVHSIEVLLDCLDNNWKDVETLIVKMLADRNRWYQDFVFARDPDWTALRKRLEAPFCRSAQQKLERLADLLDAVPDGRERMTDLARFACEKGGDRSPIALKERDELFNHLVARTEFAEIELLADAVEAHAALAGFLMTKDRTWRKGSGLTTRNGFPNDEDGKAAKAAFGFLVDDLRLVEGLEDALHAVLKPMPTRYTEDEWALIRHCFAVLRAAAIELQLVFAQTGSVDFTEVAQIALRILAPEDGAPSDFAMRQADGIRHLLIDEFQDTSRSQHQLLSRLIAAWPEREGRSCFCVGDPMQSIYGFRQAEVELFERLKTHGLEIASADPDEAADPFRFEFVALRANFRTTPTLVEDLNERFERIFAKDDGSGVRFTRADGARPDGARPDAARPDAARPADAGGAVTQLHLAFRARRCAPDEVNPILRAGEPESTRTAQLSAIVALVRRKLQDVEALQGAARHDLSLASRKLRIAILGKTKKSVILVADALRKAHIGYRAIELVPLSERPEVVDALALARAVLNPADRTAWLGILRAPWCGLTLEELHLLTSADEDAVVQVAVPSLLERRLGELYNEGRLDHRAYQAASRVHRVLRQAVDGRASSAGLALGTWLESIWKALGGEDTVSAEAEANLRLLWAALDKLPEGELDLLGPALPAALKRLCALPDPAASSEFGVQLMTIHKSKGLEFEVVIVPDLEAETKKHDRSLISWLERGLTSPTATELTEFLIAPIQPRGEQSGTAKTWVDAMKAERERQEMRRILYVAATRARDELHLFARPRFRLPSAPGSQPVLEKAGLLETAWPAFGAEIEERFVAWLAGLADPASEDIPSLAAEADSNARHDSRNLIQMPSPAGAAIGTESSILHTAKPTRLRRLREGYMAPGDRGLAGADTRRPGQRTRAGLGSDIEAEDGSSPTNARRPPLYARAAGGLQSRVERVAIHSLLEQLSRLRLTMEPAEAGRKLAESLPRMVAEIRSHGIALPLAERMAGEALAVAQRSSIDPVGAWIFAPHPGAGTETRWTGVVEGEQRELRPDRVFLSARPSFRVTAPAAADELIWWVIDYKTTRADGAQLTDELGKERFFAQHRHLYSGQLAIYAQLLRSLGRNGEEHASPPALKAPAIRAGIYYPRLRLFDSWPV